MAREEKQKLKILYVSKILQEKTDPDHSISASETIDYLEDYGINAEVKSVYRDIALLRDVYGMDIEGGQGKKYKLMSREFDFEELSLLAECVHSAKFISEDKIEHFKERFNIFICIFFFIIQYTLLSLSAHLAEIYLYFDRIEDTNVS